MGEWYDYKFKFKNSDDIITRMKEDGFISDHETNPTSVYLHIRNIIEKLPNDDIAQKLSNDFRDNIETIEIGRGNNHLFYVHKWTPSTAIPRAISLLYPEKILLTMEYAPYYDKDKTLFIKKSDFVTPSGKPITAALWDINYKLWNKMPDGNISVSLPIGEANDKWGRLILSKDNAPYCGCILLTDDTVPVRFKNKTVDMPAGTIIEQYYQSKNEYRQYAQATMVLQNINISAASLRGSEYDCFYVLPFPVSMDISDNGMASITISEYEYENLTRDGASVVDVSLGERLRERNVMVQKDGTKQIIRLTNEAIKKMYDDAINILHPNHLQTEEMQQNRQETEPVEEEMEI